MKNFIDKKGNPVHEGDILFYNESISYAESLHVVEEKNGELAARTIIGSTQGVYVEQRDSSAVELKFYCEYWEGEYNQLIDATVIGNIKDNPEYLTVEFANKFYPIPIPSSNKNN